MARPLRMDYPDTFYHILARGNERKEIFRDEKDYLRFLDTLGKMVERFTVFPFVRKGDPITMLAYEFIKFFPECLIDPITLFFISFHKCPLGTEHSLLTRWVPPI